MSSRGKRVVALLIVALFVPWLTGCPGPRFIHKGQVAPVFPSDAADSLILSTAQTRLCSVQAYRCDGAGLLLQSPKDKGSCDATIRLRAPDMARVQAEKFPAGVIFDLIALGGVVKNYVPRDKKVYVYDLSEGGTGSVATVPWGLILGVRACPTGEAPLGRQEIAREKSDIILTGMSDDEQFRERLRFEGKTLLLKTHEVQRARGGRVIKAEYAEWAQIGGIWWPLYVKIHLPLPPDEKGKSGEATVELTQRISKVKLNTNIPDIAFTLDVPSGTPEEVVEQSE